jgi:two-component system sensor histidine kinase/response regulator
MDGKRILYVDDDEAMLRIVATTLPRLAGVQVVTAATGAHALALLDRERFDLVLLDYELPDFDGATLCREVRVRVGEETPVVFLSGHEDGPQRQAGLAAGANAFLPKPSPPAVIARGIAPLLRPQPSQAPAPNARVDPYVAYRLQLLQDSQILRSIWDRIAEGEPQARDRLARFLHQLHGTSGTYGHERVSVLAHELREVVVARPPRRLDEALVEPLIAAILQACLGGAEQEARSP